jgi:hypothetical protein
MQASDMSLAAELDGLDGRCFPKMLAYTGRTARGDSEYENRFLANATLRRFCLRAALKPYSVVLGCNRFWPDMTIPFRFSLDTEGPLCLEFQITAAKATLKIGFIDADAAFVTDQELPDHWPGDLSRGQADPDLFAIAFDPACGALADSMKASRAKTCQFISGPKRTRCLQWEVLGGPVHAALVLEQGNLTFYHLWENGEWHSDGISFADLPRKVLPCIFMPSFIGYAEVQFLRMWNYAPDVCLGCGPCGRDLVNGSRHVLR